MKVLINIFIKFITPHELGNYGIMKIYFFKTNKDMRYLENYQKLGYKNGSIVQKKIQELIFQYDIYKYQKK